MTDKQAIINDIRKNYGNCLNIRKLAEALGGNYQRVRRSKVRHCLTAAFKTARARIVSYWTSRGA